MAVIVNARPEHVWPCGWFRWAIGAAGSTATTGSTASSALLGSSKRHRHSPATYTSTTSLRWRRDSPWARLELAGRDRRTPSRALDIQALGDGTIDPEERDRRAGLDCAGDRARGIVTAINVLWLEFAILRGHGPHRYLTRHQRGACQAVVETACRPDDRTHHADREHDQSNRDDCHSDEEDRWFVREEDGGQIPGKTGGRLGVMAKNGAACGVSVKSGA